jgi:hypothetical protein
MNVPGFNAEACVYECSSYYATRATEINGRGATVEAALMRGLGLTCSGSCPEGQLLCQCDKQCACCIGGCRCTLNGDVLCDKNPARSGFGSLPSLSSGSLLT